MSDRVRENLHGYFIKFYRLESSLFGKERKEDFSDLPFETRIASEVVLSLSLPRRFFSLTLKCESKRERDPNSMMITLMTATEEKRAREREKMTVQ